MDESAETTAVKRLTGQAAFDNAKKQIAERNEAAQKAGRKLREAHERQKAAEKRERELR